MLFFLHAALFCAAQSVPELIDSIKRAEGQAGTDQERINLYFALADNYMEVDKYDSAQIWLNRIAEKVPLKTPSIDNYFLSTRQAEVYYYNGLQRLGLQESERSLAIAEALNDSLLLADSYNFIGLFYINLDSLRRAIPFFKKGMHYARQPPYPAHYLSLSKPHHLYGNLAEAYEKLGVYDSALLLSHISLQMASAINWQRGMAVAQYNLGSAHLKSGHADSALVYFKACVNTAKQSGDIDVELIGYGGLAKTHAAVKNKDDAILSLQEGLSLMKEKSFVNSLFKTTFLDDAIAIYEQYGAAALLTIALKEKAAVLQKQFTDNNRQINLVLNAGLQNETRLLQLQISEEKQRNEINTIRLYLLISLIVLLLGGFLLYRNRLKQRLQLVQLQNKISQDLHDDVGSSLSSMQVYSTVADALLEQQPAKAREMLRKIAKESTTVMENIGDIVWSMKKHSDQSLEQRIKNFVADVLGAANIHYTIKVEEGVEEMLKNIEARKSILMLVKEAVNNIVKYSKAQHASVSIKRLSGHLCVQVADDGDGFSVATVRKGEGLTNMQKRTLELGGIYELTSQPGRGTTVSALLPLTRISDQL